MEDAEHKIVEEAYKWFQRLLDRDSISLDDDRVDVSPDGEMEYTIDLLDRLKNIL